MVNVPFAKDASDVNQLADWLEVTAISSDDLNASAGDLERDLNRLGVGKTEPLIGRVFSEIDRRATAAGSAYPFESTGSLLIVADEAINFIPYFFCLFLSHYGWKAKKNAGVNPWLLFEELSAVAAEQYLQGQAIVFGTSRRCKQSSFKSAVNELSDKLGEGEGFRTQPTLSCKDDKVDLVVWRDFGDSRRSKLIMFGQCAAGDNWDKKVTELQPDAFWSQWMREGVVSPFVRSFFIPHRVDSNRWDFYARKAGVFFDRCRIARLAHAKREDVASNKGFIKACQTLSGIRLK